MTHYSAVCADISGELYVQCQCIISLNYSDWYGTDNSHDLGRYWPTPSGSSQLKYLTDDLLILLVVLLVFCLIVQDYCFLYYQMCDRDPDKINDDQAP